MSWFLSRKEIVSLTLTEVMLGVRSVRPNLTLDFDHTSGFSLGKKLANLFETESSLLKMDIRILGRQLQTAETELHALLSKPAPPPVLKEPDPPLADQRNIEMENLRKELEEALSAKANLKSNVRSLNLEILQLQLINEDLNRLTAQQHQQLLDLLGSDFERPQIK